MLEQRRELDPGFKLSFDRAVCEKLEELILEKDFRVVHAYIPIAGEINITPLLESLLQRGLKVVCPKTLPRRKLENRVLHSLSELETGIMGTKHPLEAEVYEGPYDLIIVPGLAVSNDLYRVGYGGGYYDNFLADHPEALKVGVFYPFQRMDTVPTEPHDVRLDMALDI